MNGTVFLNIRLDSNLFWIVLLVTTAHLGLFFSIALWESGHNKKVSQPNSKRLVVQTVNLQSTEPTPVAQTVSQEKTSLLISELEAPHKEEQSLIQASLPSTISAPVAEPEQLSEPKPISAPQSTPKPKSTSKKPKSVAKSRAQAKPIPKETTAKLKTQKKAASSSKKAVKKKEAKKEKAKKEGAISGKSEDASKTEKKKKGMDAHKQALLAEAQKSIAKMNQSSVKLSVSEGAVLPSKIEALSVETLSSTGRAYLSTEEGEYSEALAQRLKLLLRLPEYGEVNIELTLERTGKFMQMVVVQAMSKANRAYLEKNLPKLKYPSFQDSFPDESQHTFFITLSNDL